jgi:hypothetical protein
MHCRTNSLRFDSIWFQYRVDYLFRFQFKKNKASTQKKLKGLSSNDQSKFKSTKKKIKNNKEKEEKHTSNI